MNTFIAKIKNGESVKAFTSASRLNLIMKIRKENPESAVIVNSLKPEQVLYRYSREHD
jgi:hypothetical protein